MEAELGWILEPNLNPVQPAKAAATMIEYGPVEIVEKNMSARTAASRLCESEP